MTYDDITSTLTASEGKVIKRKSDGIIYGESVMLGKTWYINGKKLDTPHDEVPDDFEEVDEEVGKQEYVDPDFSDPDYRETEEQKAQKLVFVKSDKIRAIEDYDKSDAVNSFSIGGIQMWLTFEDRTRIRSSIDAYKNEGKTSMTKWFGGKEFTFDLDTWQAMLDKLSVYASEALNVTEQHKVEVNALSTIEEMEAYDITKDYPDKLVF